MGKNGQSLGGLVLEVTERAILNNERASCEVIQRLHRFGLKIAIDDFGQGYSNFARFADLPFDVIKIDRSLINKLTVDQRMPKIVGALVAMAHGLNCTTVAEGIETQEEVVFLRQIGCTEFQGYLFSKPLDARSAVVWLANVSAKPKAITHDQIKLLKPTSLSDT